jgi:SHS family lactate transporter-like MFS transporter
MISSASAQIEAIGGAHLKKTVFRNGKVQVIPDYATVQGILLGAIATFVIFITTIGPESDTFPCFISRIALISVFLGTRNHGSNFEQQQVAFEGGAPADKERHEGSDSQSGEIDEKF